MRLVSLYVMWSAAKSESKVGFSLRPQRRAQQLRRQYHDMSISVTASWRVPETQVLVIEAACGKALGDFRTHGEWFAVRWPTAVAMVEQMITLLAPLGIVAEREVIGE